MKTVIVKPKGDLGEVNSFTATFGFPCSNSKKASSYIHRIPRNKEHPWVLMLMYPRDAGSTLPLK